MQGKLANIHHTLSPGIFFPDMVCHLSVLCSDVVLGTIYPEKGSHSCRESPAYDTKHSTLPITWPLSLIERCIKATNTTIDPSFGVVISTISHWDSSTQIIFHKHYTQTQRLTEANLIELSLTENGEGWMTSLPPLAPRMPSMSLLVLRYCTEGSSIQQQTMPLKNIYSCIHRWRNFQ